MVNQKFFAKLQKKYCFYSPFEVYCQSTVVQTKAPPKKRAVLEKIKRKDIYALRLIFLF